jgi:hypothetical protein
MPDMPWVLGIGIAGNRESGIGPSYLSYPILSIFV